MYRTPGVYREEVFPVPPAELRTGVPAFIGLVSRPEIDAHSDEFLLRQTSTPGVWLVKKRGTESAETDDPGWFTFWTEFQAAFGLLQPYGYLAYAVRGFFENQGRLCYAQVVSYDETASAEAALTVGLDTVRSLDTLDLVCAPDIMWPRQRQALFEEEALRMQGQVLGHCDNNGDRFAILDSLPSASIEGALQQRRGLRGVNGALYYPWVKVSLCPAQRNPSSWPRRAIMWPGATLAPTSRPASTKLPLTKSRRACWTWRLT